MWLEHLAGIFYSCGRERYMISIFFIGISVCSLVSVVVVNTSVLKFGKRWYLTRLKKKQVNKQKIWFLSLENMVQISWGPHTCVQRTVLCGILSIVNFLESWDRSGRERSLDLKCGRRHPKAVSLGFWWFYLYFPLNVVSLVLTFPGTYLPFNPLEVKMIPTKQYHSKFLTCLLSVTFWIWVIVLLFRD